MKKKMGTIFCSRCKKKRKIVKEQVLDHGWRYILACKHSQIYLSFSESIGLQDGLRMKGKDSDKKVTVKYIHEHRESGDKRLPLGVNFEITVNPRDNKFDQKIRDCKTGNITHEEHTSLTEHNKKQKTI